ncbi:MAG TPA: carboxypeptidase-like regulatory domain-containing protein [Gemmatales bacterium]|nr:carboxypeptidase-like regulatory domain-containing protein [Gemmatales bacterium]
MAFLLAFCCLAFQGELISAADPALRHKLCAVVQMAGDKLQIEAWYDNETPAENAVVSLFLKNKQLQQSRTDERGICTLTIPPAGDYRVQVEAGGGHRTELVFSIAMEILADDSDSKETVSNRRWWGMLLGIAIIGMATALGRRLLRGT